MDQGSSLKKQQELESIKYKLQLVSKSSKSSKLNVDDYISNILGSGLNVPKQSRNKYVSQSAQNLHNPVLQSANPSYLNNSFNVLNNQSSNQISGIHKDFFSSLPIDYQNLIDSVKQQNGDLDTQKIYSIFKSSGLTNEILGHIWNSVNRTCPGQLTGLEFAVGLAMISAYQIKTLNMHGSYRNCQNYEMLLTWDEIMSCGDFKMPILDNCYGNYEKLINNTKNLFNTTEIKHPTKSLDEMAAEQFNEACFSLTQSNITNDELDWADFSAFVPEENKCEKVRETSNASQIMQISTQKIPVPPEPQIQASNDNFECEFGDFQNFSTNSTKTNIKVNTTDVNSDKYKVFEDEQSGDVNLVDQWLLCLNCCLQIISDIVSVLNNIEEDAPAIRKEVFQTEKGTALLQGVIEVYRVTKNIKLSASKLNLLTQSESILRVLAEIETNWNQFMMIIPTTIQMDVHSKLSQKYPADTSSSSASLGPTESESSSSIHSDLCGVCLGYLDTESGFLSQGSHKYHCPCANLWVNNLNLTLPGLVQLIPTNDIIKLDLF